MLRPGALSTKEREAEAKDPLPPALGVEIEVARQRRSDLVS
jgi:hypothetical protein